MEIWVFKINEPPPKEPIASDAILAIVKLNQPHPIISINASTHSGMG